MMEVLMACMFAQVAAAGVAVWAQRVGSAESA
jgi:hypothetical protein